MLEEDIRSVLAFYAVDDESIFEMSIKDVWTKFVISKVDGVTCRNIFHSELTPTELLELVKNKDMSSDLFSDIKSEYDLGANVLFVSPVVGEPIDGFLIHQLLSH